MNDTLRVSGAGKTNYIHRIFIILLVLLLLVSLCPIRANAFVIADDAAAAGLIAYLASIMGITFGSVGDMQEAVTGFMNEYENNSDLENIMLSQSGNEFIFSPVIAVAVANVIGYIKDWFGYNETNPGEVYIPQTGYAVMVYSNGNVYCDGVPILTEGFDSTKCVLIQFSSIGETVYPCKTLPVGLKKVTPDDSYYKGQVQSVVNGVLTWDLGSQSTWDSIYNTDTYVWLSRNGSDLALNSKLTSASSGTTYYLKAKFANWVSDIVSRLDSLIYDLPTSTVSYGTTGLDASEAFVEKLTGSSVTADLTEVMTDVQSTDTGATTTYTQDGILENAGVQTGTQTGDTTVDQLDLEGLESSGLGALFISKFPFSIPWDLAKAVGLLAAPAVTPYWEIDLYAPIEHRVGSWAGDTTIEIDFSDFEILGQLSRWMSTILFVFALAAGTKRFIWTA